MRRKNGFTLIELLAIIVILAIIAVITVPIILNIIENSRRGAAIDSAYGYKDSVNKYYVTELSKLENRNLVLSGRYDVSAGGVLNGSGITNEKIPVSGDKPSSGSLTYENNVLKSGYLIIGNYKVIFNQDGTVTAEKDNGFSGGNGGGEQNGNNTSSISVLITDKSVKNVEVGSTLALTATKTNTEDSVIWTSSDNNVATVNDGVVTGLAAGSTTITATVGNASDTINITVTEYSYLSGLNIYDHGMDITYIEGSKPSAVNTYARYVSSNGVVANGIKPDACIYSAAKDQLCLITDADSFDTNISKIKDYFGYDEKNWNRDGNTWVNSSDTPTVTCIIDISNPDGAYVECYDDTIYIRASYDGEIFTADYSTYLSCLFYPSGQGSCGY